MTAAPLAAVSAAAPTAAAASACPWVNSSAPIVTRVSELMAKLSLSQEISLMTGAPYSSYVGYIARDQRAVHPGGHPGGRPGRGRRRDEQRHPAARPGRRRGDLGHRGRAGVRPGDRRRAGAKGTTVDLGPTINIVRDPRWGRAFESIGEDPYLAGQLGAADIRGVQSAGTMAQVKHFAVYNQETNRNTASDNAVVSTQAEQEIYLPAFQAAVQQGAASSVMCSYSYDQRHRRLREPVPAEHGAAPAARLPGLRDLRLGRDPLDRGLGQRRPGHGHARQRRVLRRGAAERRHLRPG